MSKLKHCDFPEFFNGKADFSCEMIRAKYKIETLQFSEIVNLQDENFDSQKRKMNNKYLL